MKMRIVLWLLCFVTLFTTITVIQSCKKGDIPFTMPKWEKQMRDAFNGTVGIPDEFTNLKESYKTPRGAKVRSTVPVPADALTAVDEGLDRQIRRLSDIFPNWSAGKNISDYTVVFIDPNTAGNPPKTCQNEVTEPGSPCVYIGGIQSAGTVLGTDDYWSELDKVLPIVVPHQQNQQWRYRDYLINSVHNESEHARGWWNRQNEPQNVFYYFLGANDAHPWQWGTQVPLVGKPTTTTNCMPWIKPSPTPSN